MTSTIHHPIAIPSRGLIICEMDEETTEPKTILEIGGVTRPKPTYIVPPPRAHVPTSINNQAYLSHWKSNDQHEIVAPPYPAFAEFQEQKIVRLANSHWTATPDEMQMSTGVIRGENRPYFLGDVYHSLTKHSQQIISILIFFFPFETDSAENYTSIALKNPHIVSSLQPTNYTKNGSTVDSNGMCCQPFSIFLHISLVQIKNLATGD